MTRRLVGALLILAMAVGSVLLWIGIPVGWLYLVSQLVDSSEPSMGPYVLVLVGIPATMVVMGKLLAILDRAYGRVTRTQARVRAQAPWHRSLRGDRAPARARSVLDVVMVASVALALVCFAVWFFLFAGSSLPAWGPRPKVRHGIPTPPTAGSTRAMPPAALTVSALARAGASASRYIAEIQRRLAAQDRVRYSMHAMGTSLEGSTADILAVAGELHAVPFDMGIPRVYSILKLDERRDREQTLEDKVSSVQALLDAD